MLIVAACDMDDDDNDINGVTDDTTEIPTDDDDIEDTDVVVPEDDDDAVGVDPQDEALEPADDEAIEFDDEEALDPEDMQPGEDQGLFYDLTFDEAQDLSPFELREPAVEPESIEFQSIMGMASPFADEEERAEQATTITFMYIQAAEDEMQQPLPVEFTQTVDMTMDEAVPPEAEQESVAIGDHDVTRVQMMSETGDEIIAYMWEDGDVLLYVAAILGAEHEESELEDMVASVPAS
jgi:hypothetical protein